LIRRTFNAQIINSILNDPKVRRWIGDDSTKGREVNYPINDQIIYLTDKTNSVLFVFVPVNSYTLDGHTAVLPNAYGDQALKSGKIAIDWIFSNTDYQKIVGATPSLNHLARRYNESLGFEREGVCTKSIQINGVLMDRIYYGLEREKWALKQRS
jgi:hypothetical protein